MGTIENSINYHAVIKFYDLNISTFAVTTQIYISKTICRHFYNNFDDNLIEKVTKMWKITINGILMSSKYVNNIGSIIVLSEIESGEAISVGVKKKICS